jgi:DNA repair exonuclease SbcCD ATPase subunit
MPSKKKAKPTSNRKIILKKSPVVANLRSKSRSKPKMNESKLPPVPADSPSPALVSPSSPDESLDKVRDILFGAQSREFERRFAMLEADLLRKTAEARAEADQRLEALEAQLRQDVEQLTDRLQAEHDTRTENIKSVTAELKSLTRQLDDKITELGQNSTEAQEDIRQQLVDEAKLLSNQIEQQSDELQATITHEVEQLDKNKLNRADISQMFSEMAKRFMGEKGK